MSVDLEELKRLAQAATPGPWSTKEYGPDHLEVLLPNGFSRIISDPTVVTDYDARYIAAANPAAVLALIERVERAEADNAALLKSLDTIGHALGTAEMEAALDVLLANARKPHPGIALLERVKALETFASNFVDVVAGDLANEEAWNKGGMRPATLTGDFVRLPPSAKSRLRWWAARAQEALGQTPKEAK